MKKKIFKDKSVQSETCDFYAHMALTYERHFARCFCRYFGNITQRYFLYNKIWKVFGFRGKICYTVDCSFMCKCKRSIQKKEGDLFELL